MAQERSGQTLQATALVHEAYIRLVNVEKAQHWDSRGHFFAAAAEAMRRILVERARKKKRLKRGGERVRADLLEHDLRIDAAADEVLAVDDALDRFSQEDPLAAEILKLKYYGGLSVDDAAGAHGLSRATAYRHWAYSDRESFLNDACREDDSLRKSVDALIVAHDSPAHLLDHAPPDLDARSKIEATIDVEHTGTQIVFLLLLPPLLSMHQPLISTDVSVT